MSLVFPPSSSKIAVSTDTWPGRTSILSTAVEALGLALDVLFLRLSLGAGPNFTAKANADLKLGKVTLGLSYIMGLVVDGGAALDKSTGMLGVSVLYWF